MEDIQIGLVSSIEDLHDPENWAVWERMLGDVPFDPVAMVYRVPSAGWIGDSLDQYVGVAWYNPSYRIIFFSDENEALQYYLTNVGQ